MKKSAKRNRESERNTRGTPSREERRNRLLIFSITPDGIERITSAIRASGNFRHNNKVRARARGRRQRSPPHPSFVPPRLCRLCRFLSSSSRESNIATDAAAKTHFHHVRPLALPPRAGEHVDGHARACACVCVCAAPCAVNKLLDKLAY